MRIYPTLVIISSSRDEHVASVLSEIPKNTLPFVLDFRAYGRSFNSTVTVNGHKLDFLIRDRSGNEFDLSNVSKVWWRRPQKFLNDCGFVNYVQTFIRGETASFWRGALTTLEKAIWYNHFDLDRVFDRKIYQLCLAQKIGFPVPATCITSSPMTARDFINEHNCGVIFKSFGGSEEFWQPARLYRNTMRRFLPTITRCPVIFQQFISGIDYRVTIIDEEVFAAEKDVRTSAYPFDVRITTRIPYKKSKLPGYVLKSLKKFMNMSGLRYGAFDLRQDKAGQFWFLEVNPAGQFLYIELQTGFPIAKRMATALATVGGHSTAHKFKDEWGCANQIFAVSVPQKVKHLR